MRKLRRMEIPHKYCAWCGYRFGDTEFSCGNCQSERGIFNTPEEPDGQALHRCCSASSNDLYGCAQRSSSGGQRKASHGGESEERWQKVCYCCIPL